MQLHADPPLQLSRGRTPTGVLALSPLLGKGAADQTEVDTYSVLRYIEDLFGLDYLGKAADAMPLTLAVPLEDG